MYLVKLTIRRIILLTALDALFVTLSAGTLAWYFVLGPSSGVAGLNTPREVLMSLFVPAGDAALLFLSLTVFLTARRPPFMGLLVAAFAAFLLADALFLKHRSSGVYEMGHWPELAWALGIVFIGLAALGSLSSPAFVHRSSISPRVVFSFWCGPLSPALHYGVLLAWGLFNPPLPGYVLLGGAALLFYLAFRTSLLSHVDHQLATEREERARRAEQSRISKELHDNLKQDVRSIPLMLRAYREARDEGKQDAAEEILDRLMETSQEACYRVSRPIYELQAGSGRSVIDPALIVDQLLKEVRETFGIQVHEDVKAPLDELPPEKLTTACRVIGEALWNAAKHSGAKNVRVSTGRVGSVFLVKVRDDGRGFCAKNPPPGLGLPLMRSRAEEAGGTLDVVSKPGSGTTVQLRFDNP